MDYISFIAGVLLLYSLTLSVECASIPARQKRQSLGSDPDKIYFQDEFEEYKHTLQYAQIDDKHKRFGLDEQSIKQMQANANKMGRRRNKRQMLPRFSSGFNDVSGGGGFGKFPGFFPMPGDENDLRPVWDITPATTARPARQEQQQVSQETTTLPGPATWATPPSRCVRGCQVTPQYNPVCGTDGITYSNLARLQCEVRCGKNIQLNHYGNCTRTTTQGPPIRRIGASSRRRQP